MQTPNRPVASLPEHIDVKDIFALSVWAHHFNVSETVVKDTVQIIGTEPKNVEHYLASSQNILTS